MADWIGLMSFILLTLACTYLFGDNPGFRFVEGLLAGAYMGHFIVMTYASLNKTLTQPLMAGQFALLLPFALSLLLFANFAGAKWRWLAMYPTAILTGVGLGVSLRAILRGQLISNLVATILPFNKPDMFTNFTNLFFIIATALSVYYFIFGYDFKGPLLTLNKAGRMLVLLALGAQAGNMFISIGGYITYYTQYVGFLMSFLGLA